MLQLLKSTDVPNGAVPTSVSAELRPAPANAVTAVASAGDAAIDAVKLPSPATANPVAVAPVVRFVTVTVIGAAPVIAMAVPVTLTLGVWRASVIRNLAICGAMGRRATARPVSFATYT